MDSSNYNDQQRSADTKVLHDMGYAQELARSMGRFQNFAISFSIICIMSGGINSLGQATSGAGGAAIGFGWPLGCLISLVFALCLAQISSAYPTAGGLYHWGSILGNRFTGWLSAWLNLLGLITVLGAINVGTFYFALGAFPELGLQDDVTHRVAFVAAITAVMALINHFGIRFTALLTDLSGYLIFATAIAMTLICAASITSWDFSRLFTFDNFTGTPGASAVWPSSVSQLSAFLLGLLLPIYTITGYDASAHTSEETKNAELSVPRGMVSSVIWSAIFGWIMLCAFVLMIPDQATVLDPADETKTKMITLPGMQAAATQGWSVFFWAMDLTVNPAVKKALFVAILICQLLCGLATVTSASRMIYAFARDGGLPASGFLSKVSPSYRTPVGAIWTGSILQILFVWGTSLVSIGDTSAYSIVVSCTVIFLFLSFTLPIALGLFAYGGPKWPKMGPWSMGRALYSLVAILSILSMALIIYLGVQPPNAWALPITIGFLVLAGLVWVLFENSRFKGPPIGEEIKRRQAQIAAAEAAVGERP